MGVQVVQCLTELGLSILRARISSDGGWFVDGARGAGPGAGAGCFTTALPVRVAVP